MVIAVDPQTIISNQCRQRRPGGDSHRVDGTVIRRGHAVYRAGRVLRWQVLVQCAAKRRVQQLNPAANAEQRLVAVQNFAQQRGFHRVARRAGLAAVWRRGCAVQRRIHVLPAGEQEPVAVVGQGAQLCGVIGQRQHDRETARLGNSVHISRQHPQG